MLPSFTSASSHTVGKFVLQVSLPKNENRKRHNYNERVIGEDKKKNHRKTVKVSIILAGIKCSSAHTVQLSGTREVLTLKLFDSGYSCEQGYKFLAGDEIEKEFKDRERSRVNGKEQLRFEYVAVISDK